MPGLVSRENVMYTRLPEQCWQPVDEVHDLPGMYKLNAVGRKVPAIHSAKVAFVRVRTGDLSRVRRT